MTEPLTAILLILAIGLVISILIAVCAALPLAVVVAAYAGASNLPLTCGYHVGHCLWDEPRLLSSVFVVFAAQGAIAVANAIIFWIKMLLAENSSKADEKKDWDSFSDFVRSLSKFFRIPLISGAFLGVVIAISFYFTQPYGAKGQMDAQSLKITLYSIFVFVFSFALTSYFLRDILPWRDESPLFNTILSVLGASLLSSVAAISVHQSGSTAATAEAIANRYSDMVALGVNILFILMGMYLFLKKAKAYAKK